MIRDESNDLLYEQDNQQLQEQELIEFQNDSDDLLVFINQLKQGLEVSFLNQKVIQKYQPQNINEEIQELLQEIFFKDQQLQTLIKLSINLTKQFVFICNNLISYNQEIKYQIYSTIEQKEVKEKRIFQYQQENEKLNNCNNKIKNEIQNIENIFKSNQDQFQSSNQEEISSQLLTQNNNQIDNLIKENYYQEEKNQAIKSNIESLRIQNNILENLEMKNISALTSNQNQKLQELNLYLLYIQQKIGVLESTKKQLETKKDQIIQKFDQKSLNKNLNGQETLSLQLSQILQLKQCQNNDQFFNVYLKFWQDQGQFSQKENYLTMLLSGFLVGIFSLFMISKIER